MNNTNRINNENRVNRKRPVRKLERARQRAEQKEGMRLQTVEILQGVALLTLAASALVAPNMAKLIFYFDIKERDRRRFHQKISQMKRNNYITVRAGSVSLAEKGRRLVSEEKIWDLEPDPPRRWNGAWFMVAFDIPKKYEKSRHTLRARLRELGFFRYQNSLYVHWVDARAVVSAFADFYSLAPYVKYFTVTGLDDSDAAIAHCKPPR